MSASLAIVVPAGPGDFAWRGLLPQLQGAGARDIVLALADCDAGATGTLPSNVTVVASPPGRARQLNAGAACSDADWLWFLHADSRIVPSTVAAMRGFINSDAAAIGYFDLRFLADGPRLMRLTALGAFVRSRWLRLPFGDQGFVLPRRMFLALGGFDEGIAGGEDHALVWAARAQGVPLRPLRAPIYTSARKYARHGWWATTREHLRLTLGQARAFSRREASR
jgi:hypothetical protein